MALDPKTYGDNPKPPAPHPAGTERMEALERKYSAVLALLDSTPAMVRHLEMRNDKLTIRVASEDPQLESKVQKAIEEADPAHEDIVVNFNDSIPQQAHQSREG